MAAPELCSGQALAEALKVLTYGVHKVHKITEEQQL